MYIKIDNVLLSELKKGNEDAYARIFSLYGKTLYSFAYRYLKSEADAEDAVQHTFMRLWIKRNCVKFDDDVFNLLYTIMKNHILNELRHRSIVLEANYALAQAEDDDGRLISEIERRNEWRRMLSEISSLPERKRDICMLKLMKGLSNKEIAKVLNIAVPTVKVHYNQAIKILKRNILGFLLIMLLLEF